MEREGEGREMKRRGREMRRRGIVIGGITLFLLFGCNNGMAELEKKNQFLSSLANLGNEFLNVFTSFGDIFTETLGFKADTKKSEVATYFKNVQSSLEKTKTALNKIVADMKAQENSNAVGVETAVKTLNEKLTTIIDGAKTASGAIGDPGSELLGNVAPGGNGVGVGAKGENVENLAKGMKSIIDLVLGNKGIDVAGTDKKASDGSSGRTANGGTDEAGKLFGNTGNQNGIDNASNAKKVASDASKAVGAVTGAGILQAIAKGESGDAAQLANSDPKGAVTKGNVKDATIAGAIALRAMAKGGKFANANDAPTSEVVTTVKDAAVSAVTKALDTLTIAIKRTIDEGLKKVKEAMKINPEDNPVTTEAKN